MTPMPETPNREIEQRLRAAAETRRAAAGGPFALHPADRRGLQDEVARAFPRPATGAQPGWWRWLVRHRAGLGFGGALALVLFISVPALLRPASQKTSKPTSDVQAATKSEAPRPNARQATKLKSAPPAPAAAPLLADKIEKTPAPPAVAAAPPAPMGLGGGANRDLAVTATAREVRQDAVPPDAVLALQAGRGQAIASHYAAAVGAAQATVAPSATRFAEPLSQFRFEQRGTVVTVVDADGSVYTGALESSPADATITRAAAADAAQVSGPMRRRFALAAPSPAQALAQDRLEETARQDGAFRVTGTNRTLQQAVVFSGHLPGAAPHGSGTQNWVRAPMQNQPGLKLSQTVTSPPLSTNAPLKGELQVGPGSPMPFQAMPAGR